MFGSAIQRITPIIFIILAFILNAFYSQKNLINSSSAFAIETVKARKPESDIKPGFFPQKAAGFELDGKVKQYNGKDLYLAIDGEADLFLNYGFIRMQIARYKSGKNIYEIQLAQVDSLYNAYGLFSSYTNQYGKFVRVGSMGFAEDNVLTFFRDKRFVRIQNISQSEGKSFGKDLKKLADYFSGKLEGKLVVPVEISYFPKAGLIDYSVRYVPKNVLGKRNFKRGFEAEYNYNGKTGRAFIVIFDNKKDAENACRSITGNRTAAVSGVYLAGAEGFSDKSKAEKLVRGLKAALDARAGNQD
ncbi:MAG: hypothetical protein LWY06_03180 [Firmicutes bacterium]|nr:hypothetical protein [Bacillota bacterium]